MYSQHSVAHGCRDLVEPRAHNIERRTLVQQVGLDAVRHRYSHVEVQGDRFGDDFLSPLVKTKRRQELLGSECALHGEALSATGAQLIAGAKEGKVVQC